MPIETHAADLAAHWLLFAVLAGGAILYVRRARRARRAPSRARLVLGNLLLTLALLAGMLATGETYLRLVYDATSWHAEALTTRAWLRRHASLNRDGFREVEFAREKQPGTRRVAFMGDSFTFGYGIVDPADRAPDLVRRSLVKTSPGRIEVWNLGQIGASTGSQLVTLRALLANVQLDHVVLAYSLNDIEDLLPPARHHVAPFGRAEPGSLREHSYVLDHLVMRASLLDDTGAVRFFDDVDALYHDPARFAGQARRIEQFAGMCRTAGVRLDVIVWPLISHWGPGYPFDAAHERVASAWRSAGVEVVDLRRAFAGLTVKDLRVNALDAHPNERANALAAEELLRRIRF